MTYDIIQGVFDLAEVALSSKPSYLMIDYEKVNTLAEKMKKDGVVSFYEEEKQKKYTTGVFIEILKEVVACSINYCYWYGMHDIRPFGVSSTSMYEDLNDCFDDAKGLSALNFERRISDLIERLSSHRYPLIEERKRHLYELCEDRRAEEFAEMVNCKTYSGERLFNEMIGMFTGFASDMFLKRVSLFFIQLYRKYGWYGDDLMKKIFVPSDYQVPKILRHFECIRYSTELAQKIDNSVLIPKHSLEEIQIRAATIKVCQKLQELTGWLVPDIDTYLWTKRKLTDDPFHCTITTDY
jgi:hypothetical protein